MTTAVEVLKAIEDSNSGVVLAGLTSGEAGARAFAANGVASLQIENAADQLAALLGDQNMVVRATAAGALGRLGASNSAVAEALVTAFDDDPLVARLAVQACGALQVQDAVLRIVAAYDETDDAVLQAEIIRALGAIGDEVALDLLIGLLNSEHVGEAVQAIGEVGHEAGFDPLVDRFAAGVNGFVEWWIVAAIRDIGARDRVYEVMKSHPDPETRRMLGRVADEWWPDERAVRALVNAMSDEAATTRSGAAYRLRNYNLPDELQSVVKQALQRGLQDDDEDVRHWCEETLETWDEEA